MNQLFASGGHVLELQLHWTQVSRILGGFFTYSDTREALHILSLFLKMGFLVF